MTYTIKAKYINGTVYTRECLNAISLMFSLDKIANDVTIVTNTIYVINNKEVK